MSVESKHELLQQGVEWFRNNQEYLQYLCLKQILEYAKANQRELPVETARQLANEAITAYLLRLEGQRVNPEDMKQVFSKAFASSPVSFQEMQKGIENQKNVIAKAIQQGLAKRPDVAEVLAEHIKYITQVAQAAMAAAHVSFQAGKNG